MKRTPLALSLAICLSLPALAHTPRPFSGSDGQIMWDLDTAGFPTDNVIRYVINPTRPAASPIQPAGEVTEQEIVDAIRGVFQAWENVPTSKLRFKFLGVDHDAQFSEDGVVLVTLDYTDPGAQPCGGTNAKNLTIAPAGLYTLDGTGEVIPVVTPFSIVDYDIALCAVPYSLDGRDGTYDLAALLTHELGHMFGHGHTILQPTSMSGYPASMGSTQRTLSRDDEIGISVLYPAPDFFATTGTIDGRIEELDEGGQLVGEVFGAHITVIDAVTGEAITETITGVTQVDPVTHRAVAWDRDKLSGRFIVSGLPPGTYHLRVDAYDGPRTVGSTGKIINLGFFDWDEMGPRRDFGYVMDNTPYTVAAGEVLDIGSLSAGPFDELLPNVDAQMDAWIDDGNGADWRQPAVALAGATTSLRIPKGVNAGPGDTFTVDGTNDVQLLNPRWSGDGEYILVEAVVATDAPLGPHNVVVSNGHGFSLIHGGLMIASGPPALDEVGPPCGPAGADVEVRGQHFTPDTHVSFNGALAADLVVVDPTLITARLPGDVTRPVAVTLASDAGTDEIAFDDDADLDGDEQVHVTDMLILLAAWGPCLGSCLADLTCDGIVGVDDFLALLADWSL